MLPSDRVVWDGFRALRGILLDAGGKPTSSGVHVGGFDLIVTETPGVAERRF